MRWDNIEEHLDEAAFLWERRQRALCSPEFSLVDVEKIESRLEAHVDALGLATAPQVLELLEAALHEEPARAAVAVLTLMARDDAAALGVLAAFISDGAREQREALAGALGTRACPRIEPMLRELVKEGAPWAQSVAMDVLAQWKRGPDFDLQPWWCSEDTQVQAAAFRWSARVPRSMPSWGLQRGLESPEDIVWQSAAEAGLVHAPGQTWAECVERVRLRRGPLGFPLVVLALGGAARELTWVVDVLSSGTWTREALWALGFSGRLPAVEACVELLRREAPVARLAGEAFSAMTGLKLTERFVLQPSAPDDALVPLEEEDLDADLRPRPEDDLPIPEPDEVSAWWSRTRREWRPDGRFLSGGAWTGSSLLAALEHGSARRRPVHALELAIRSRGAHVVSLHAWAVQQKREVVGAQLAGKFSDQGFERMQGLVTWAKAPSNAGVSPRPAARERSRPGSLSVCALGMASPLGDSAVESCAASRAGLSRVVASDEVHVWDADAQEMRAASGCVIPVITEGFTGLARLVRLATAGLRDLLRGVPSLDMPRTGLFLALPDGSLVAAGAAALLKEADVQGEAMEESFGEAAGALPQRCARHLLPILARLIPPLGGLASHRLYFEGRLGYFHALQEARKQLELGGLDHCIVGGVDSLMDTPVLEALKATRRLKAPQQPVGCTPGECAAFVLLGRERCAGPHSTPCCMLEGPSVTATPRANGAIAPHAGMALAETLSGALVGSGVDGRQVALSIGSLNGAERQAYAWGLALVTLRSRGLLTNPAEWFPALSFGEIGAATAPAALCFAVRAFELGRVPGRHCLVWGADDDGGAGAFVLTGPFPGGGDVR
ncbi:TIGR02270 family protein [Corallococcus macrosporus]|uniref:Beta-ketoacyl synthase N-terminal domain-containing protein n=1 Tax=Corallococcus macrosporus DSM 14697 TaxID=1189310 RepID=A0A250K1S5_9BACT|nr:TIGR02270 family protein [Corallococcus macrosporus]ATB50044.1 hypothetical protein MYMAC_005699 [Corallococcus macrosporus DSM 14697]